MGDVEEVKRGLREALWDVGKVFVSKPLLCGRTTSHA